MLFSRLSKYAILGIVPLLMTGNATVSTADDPKDIPRISVHQVQQGLGNPEIVIIDVRKARNWLRSSSKIPTSVREDPYTPNQWFNKYAKEKTLIFYCA